ncbi:nitrite reductase [Nocardioides pyridinolyticus]
MPTRTRPDRCPGALRPWPADDGLLVRLRLVGGQITRTELSDLVAVAEQYGDGRVHLTGRANLQLRGLPGADGRLTPEALAAIEGTGLLPSLTHELVRNIMVAPRSEHLWPVAHELDRLLCADERLSELPGRFLFVLDLPERPCDLGLVALDDASVQLRVGDRWGEVVALADAVPTLIALAHAFLDLRTTEWHVAELPAPLTPPRERDARAPDPVEPIPYGERHLPAADGIDRALVGRLDADDLVITPWKGVLLP